MSQNLDRAASNLKEGTMNPLTINTQKPYEVISEPGALSFLGAICARILKPCKICVVTEDNVDILYADLVTQSLEDAGFAVHKIVFAPGEHTKSLISVGVLLDFLAEKEFTRTDVVLALGGGVMGDLSGFAASVYLRGIKYIQVPTTFLAAVDSSVGGKTGVNLASGKNLAGTFWQPALVVFDPKTMDSLGSSMVLDGLAETIKCGMIGDKVLFEFLENAPWHGLPTGQALYDFVQRCAIGAIAVKQKLVEADEKDLDLRQLLNFGHTIGHAIELSSRYTISHGQAVAKGMVVVTRAAMLKGWSKEDCLTPLLGTLNKYGFPLEFPYAAEALAEIALRDKKRKGRSINLVIPVRKGEGRLKSIDIDNLKEFIEMGMQP
jgi:3-dehydroquinate synthase